MRAALLGLAAVLAIPVVASSAPEDELAARYAPVVRLVAQAEPCGDGEPYVPTDVDALLGRADVALRGPWQEDDLVRVGPTADDLAPGLPGYHLDYPGDPLNAGCDYEAWSDAVVRDSAPTMYAHVVADPAHPGQIALQYWFFYLFNDFNNTHEGDWEMIQLVFPAATAEAALAVAPAQVGFSQHEGAEAAAWGDAKLELVDGTHPVVYPAAGSHANYFEPALYLGRSAAQGVGCDATIGPHVELRPRVAVVPGDPAAAAAAYPWIAYTGHWGQREAAFYNGPTGPSTKAQWTAPITWVEEEWRPQSFAIGAARALGPSATDVFCAGVGAGSSALTRLARAPLQMLVLLGVLAFLVARGARRTRWQPSAPLRIERRRALGQIITGSVRMYRLRPRVFAGIGLLFVPAMVLATAIQAIVFHVDALLAPLLAVAGPTNAAVAGTVVVIGTVTALLAAAAVQVVTACALLRIDRDEPVGVAHLYADLRPRLRPLVTALLPLTVAVLLLTISLIGLPVAIWLVGRAALTAQVVAIEGRGGLGAALRSSALVRGRFLRVAVTIVLVTGLGLLAGPLVGVALLFGSSASFDVVNLVSSLVYAATMPFVAIATTYLFLDTRLRAAEPAQPEVAILPAETPA